MERFAWVQTDLNTMKLWWSLKRWEQPAVFDNFSNARFHQYAVINTELQDVTHTLGWLKVPRQQLNIENPHLISCCVRHNHLCGSSQVPIIQLSYHPFGNVVRVVFIIKRSTTKYKRLPLPVIGNIIWRSKFLLLFYLMIYLLWIQYIHDDAGSSHQVLDWQILAFHQW